MIFVHLFFTFFMIGLFGFGGGYGMLSMIQTEVVTHHAWISAAEFTDIVAVSQMTPGPIGINSATYIGFTAVCNAGYSHGMGVLGSLLASCSVMLPSFILMLLISKFLMKYRKHPSVEAVFSIIRPVVVGMLAAAALLLMTPETFGSLQHNPVHFFLSIAFFLFAFVGLRYLKMNPIVLIIICGALSGVIYSFV